MKISLPINEERSHVTPKTENAGPHGLARVSGFDSVFLYEMDHEVSRVPSHFTRFIER